MNIKNALGFLVLGVLMYAFSLLTPFAEVQETTIASVRTLWLEFMGWVIGGIGFARLTREAAIRTPALMSLLTPERLLRPVGAQREPMQLPVGVRVVVSS